MAVSLHRKFFKSFVHFPNTHLIKFNTSAIGNSKIDPT
jgi:hypothetical protein